MRNVCGCQTSPEAGRLHRVETGFILLCAALHAACPLPLPAASQGSAPRPGCTHARLRDRVPVFPSRAVVEAVHRLDLILCNKTAYQEVFKPENISLRNK